MLPVTVYSNSARSAAPGARRHPRVVAAYRTPEEYRANDRGLVILDRFIPPERPAADSIWIEPPGRFAHRRAPDRGAGALHALGRPPIPPPPDCAPRISSWNSTLVFEPAPGDARIGEVAAGPVIVARPAKPKIVVFGFHPALSAMRYELAAPLLFANLLRWVSPEIFRRSEIAGGSVGTVKAELGPGRGREGT